TNSYASCTPALEAGRVYIHFGAYGTACLDAKTAETIWERRDFVCDDFRGPGSSPILFENLLIVNFDGYDFDFVVALNKETGETVWKTDRNCEFGTLDGDMRKAYGTCTVIEHGGRTQLLSTAAKYTFSYDPRSGAELWRAEVGGMNSGSRPIYAHGLVYVSTGDGGDGLAVIRPDGVGDVTKTHLAWKTKQVISKRPSPLIVDDLLFVLSDEGVASTRDAATGDNIWKQRLPGKYWASPVFADGRVYLFSQDGDGVVMKLGKECTTIAENKLDKGCNASPAVVGDTLFVRTFSHLYRIDP
ncbi:MAG TPA: PQQ-binding-like beta-propeller repeat protein, partial [Pirellulales bacterium]